MLIFLHALLFVAALLGIAYSVLALWATLNFYSEKRKAPLGNFTPPVSILKPLCGLDPNGYNSLRSHCIQDYPSYEIVFGVAAPDDPAVGAVEQLMAEFPQLSIRLVICSNVFGMNFKISNLVQMLPEARYEYLLINDSDIGVPRDYLRKVLGPLQDPVIGIVTCLYRGVASQSIGSRLEMMGIESDFIPGILFAKQLEKGIHFAMGSTIAFHRDVLERIGGLASIADYLADDYELGHRVAEAGYEIALADCVVDHYLPRYSWGDFFQHQLRWARTVRSCRPEGYAGLVVTFAFPWSLLSFAASPSIPGVALLLIALVLRSMTAVGSGYFVLGDRRVFRNLWLIPVRDFVSLAIWILSYTGSHIVWRGNKFELANGKLRPA
jgi:ceramide glucosyltransferase